MEHTIPNEDGEAITEKVITWAVDGGGGVDEEILGVINDVSLLGQGLNAHARALALVKEISEGAAYKRAEEVH